MAFVFIVAMVVHSAAGSALRGPHSFLDSDTDHKSPKRPSMDDWKKKQETEAAGEQAKLDKQSKMAAVDKVVALLEDLQSKVLLEGESEANTYNKFACWCKDTVAEKSSAIKDGSDLKASLEGDIGKLASERDDLDKDIAQIQKDVSDTEKKIKEEKVARGKEAKEYEMNAADLTHALGSLEDAIKALKASKKPSLIQMQDVFKTVRNAILVADALNLGGVSAEKVSALLQQPKNEVQMEDYKFHSNDIISTLEKLLGDFRKEKQTIDAAEVKAASASTMKVQKLTQKVEVLSDKLNDKEKMKAKTIELLETASQRLTTTAAQLLDDQEYLLETSQLCSEKAKTWDQRSKLRQDELTMLTQVIGIIKDKVTKKTSKATVRLAQTGVSIQLARAVASSDAAMEAVEAGVEVAETDPVNFLQKSPGNPNDGARSTIAELLRHKGDVLHSVALTALAGQLSKDPFAKVKTLIQELIERLLQEAANEADHKGWCDKAISDATQKRDYAAREIRELNGEMAELESIRDKLDEEIKELNAEMKELDSELKNATNLRLAEKKENLETIQEAKEGEAAIDGAIDIVDKFYKTSKKETVNLKLAQRAPSDDAPDAGFDNGEAYVGAQSESGGILAMMDVMKSDFIRTQEETEIAEKKAEAEFLTFSTENRKSFESKSESFKAKRQQLSSTKTKLTKADESLTSQSDILVGKLNELQQLKPACIATGMTYAERVARRQKEIDALQNALCILEAYAEYGPDGAAKAC